MTRILVADDHELLRDTLVCYLKSEAAFEVDAVGDYPAAAAAVSGSRDYDLILLDFNMPGMSGLESLTELMEMGGGQRVALISGAAGKAVATQALAAGAAGFLPKTLPARSLVDAVRQMTRDEQFVPPTFRALDVRPMEPDVPMFGQLSQREKQAWQGLALGKSNKEIARDLDVAETTVKLHVKTLYRKLGVANRTQAALLAKDAGVF